MGNGTAQPMRGGRSCDVKAVGTTSLIARRRLRSYCGDASERTERSDRRPDAIGTAMSKTRSNDVAQKVKKAAVPAKRASGRKAAIPVKGSDRSDPVGLILSQWQRERPDLDPAPMQLFGLVARAQSLSDAYFNKTLERWDFSRGSFDVLAALRRAGPPFSLTPKQLSNSLMLSGAGMTSRLDRLEAQKFIIRLPEPNDRRSLKIQLTPRGVRLIDEIVPAVVEAQWKIASALGLGRTASLTNALRGLTNVLAQPAAAERRKTPAVARR